MKVVKILLACIKKADIQYNLISNKDKIALGISGGKDSMALLYLLSLYKKFSNTNFKIYPIFIDLGFKNNSIEDLKKFVSSLGFELIIADGKSVFEILKIQKEKQKLNKLPCSICSRMKKAIINKEAKKYNCNKVSFAHHKDDALETLLLNEIYGARVATFSPKMHLSNENITFIRPLIFAKENDIKKLIKEENIPTFPSFCPNDKQTKREDIKNLLLDLYKLYPSSENNFLTMLKNDEHLDLFYLHDEFKIDNNNTYIKKVNNIEEYKSLYNFFLKNKDNKEYIFNLKNNLLKVDNKFNLTYLNIYKSKRIVGSLILKKIDSSSFSIEDYIFMNKVIFLKVLNILINQIYFKINPFKLIINVKDIKIKNELSLLGFNKENSSKFIKVINYINLK